MNDAPSSFEESLKELEGLVEHLERGQTGLDEAIVLWERGEELLRLCLGRLDAAQGKIEELAQRAEQSAPASPQSPDSIESGA